jgi:SnoaL-like domain
MRANGWMMGTTAMWEREVPMSEDCQLCRDLHEIERIKVLKAQYFRFMDLQQWGQWRDLFTDECEIFLNYKADRPLAGIPAWFSADDFVDHVGKLLKNTHTTTHGYLPEVTLISEATATGIWASRETLEHPDDPGRRFTAFGYYYDSYQLGADDNWRISRLELVRVRVHPLTEAPRTS